MNVLVLQLFVSLVLVAGSLVLFVYSVRQRDHEHADRLSLAPLEEDQPASVLHSTTAAASKENVCSRDGSSTTTP